MKEGNDYMKDFTLKINGKEIFFDDINDVFELVSVTYGTCDVVFADNRDETTTQGVRIETKDDLINLADEYANELELNYWDGE